MASIKEYALAGISLLIAAIMIPIGMQQIVGTTTTSWNTAVTTMWQVLLPVLMIIGVAILFISTGLGGKAKKGVSMMQVIGIIVGFVVTALVTPVAMNYLVSINSTFNVTGVAATYSAVYTIFSVLLPVLYMIGVAIKFIPHGKGHD